MNDEDVLMTRVSDEHDEWEKISQLLLFFKFYSPHSFVFFFNKLCPEGRREWARVIKKRDKILF